MAEQAVEKMTEKAVEAISEKAAEDSVLNIMNTIEL
jgi:hypothetical protein